MYLSDVSTKKWKASDQLSEYTWESTFRASRWFTRGWTLQELLAPTLVEFFSKDGKKIGNKKVLELRIREITGIPIKALQGDSLSSFSIAERLSWQDSRETTRKEDKVYSLMGICGVHMPLIYGEGRDSAFRRLLEEIKKASKGK